MNVLTSAATDFDHDGRLDVLIQGTMPSSPNATDIHLEWYKGDYKSLSMTLLTYPLLFIIQLSQSILVSLRSLSWYLISHRIFVLIFWVFPLLPDLALPACLLFSSLSSSLVGVQNGVPTVWTNAPSTGPGGVDFTPYFFFSTSLSMLNFQDWDGRYSHSSAWLHSLKLFCWCEWRLSGWFGSYQQYYSLSAVPRILNLFPHFSFRLHWPYFQCSSCSW